jgi:hypothetical protein
MKRMAAAFVLLFTALTLALPLHAADGDEKKPGKKKKDAEQPAGGGSTFVGDLCVKPKGAGDGVVCGLISKTKGEEQIYLLKADGEIAKQIANMREQGMRAKVTGTLNEKILTVQKIEQNVPKK